jgi:hypothetical protein
MQYTGFVVRSFKMDWSTKWNLERIAQFIISQMRKGLIEKEAGFNALDSIQAAKRAIR